MSSYSSESSSLPIRSGHGKTPVGLQITGSLLSFMVHSPDMTLQGGGQKHPPGSGQPLSWEAWLSGQNKASSNSVQRLRHLRISLLRRLAERPAKALPLPHRKPESCLGARGTLGSALTSDFRGGAALEGDIQRAETGGRGEGCPSQDTQGERVLFTF